MNNIGNNYSNLSQILGKFMTKESLSNDEKPRNDIYAPNDANFQNFLCDTLKSSEVPMNYLHQYPQGSSTNMSQMLNFCKLLNNQGNDCFQNPKRVSNCYPTSLGFPPHQSQFSQRDFLGQLQFPFHPLNQMNLNHNQFNPYATMSEPQILNFIKEYGTNYLPNNNNNYVNSIEGNPFIDKRQRSHDEEEDLGKTRASVSRLPSSKEVVIDGHNERLKLFLASQKFVFPKIEEEGSHVVNINQVGVKEEPGKPEEVGEISPQQDYQQNDMKKPLIDKSKFFRCTFKDCDKVFPKECNLKDHIRTHTGEKPYKCSFPGCDKSFSQHGNLKKHEKVHIGDKKFFCDFPRCGKRFSASYNLKIHYRCHTGEKPYKCNFENCGRSFYDKGNLKYHEKTAHTMESINFPFSCEHMGCNIKFKTKKQKLMHHNKMEPECKNERNSLIKLLKRYKQLLKFLVKSNNIDVENFEALTSLKSFYGEIENKLLDPDYFHSMLGQNFEDDCGESDCQEEAKPIDEKVEELNERGNEENQI